MATLQLSEVSPGRSKPHEAMAAVMSRILAGSARTAAGGLRKREVEHGGSVETGNQRKRRKLKVNHYKEFKTCSMTNSRAEDFTREVRIIQLVLSHTPEYN